MAPVEELAAAYQVARRDPAFQAELSLLLKDFAGRPTSLFRAKRLTARLGGAQIYLKREEDLLHTGAHKINNSLWDRDCWRSEWEKRAWWRKRVRVSMAWQLPPSPLC